MRLRWAVLSMTWLLSAAEGTIEFNRDIRPILSDRCIGCHGPDANARKIKLRLDIEADAKADLGGRFAIIPGDSAKSELTRRITAKNAGLRMPPLHTGTKLTEREIELLTRWVDQGAKWQKHWAFVAPTRPELPQVNDASWVRNPIDRFVLQRLEREGLRPSPEADLVTLLRRASLDLTGLPPSPSEVDSLLQDKKEGAYERAIDRLLASPRYGEKMAARWLDAARYADTNGYQTDAERHMWRWRDWVIEAFNHNMPFNQFTVEQIAGDLLPNATVSQRVATGFNRNHRGNSEGGIVPEEYLVEYAVDRLETMSTVFLGLTTGCARCHNHKYDPIAQREFYQLLAYFNNIPELGRYLKYGNTPPYVKAPTPAQEAELAKLDKKVNAAEQQFQKASGHIDSSQRQWERTIQPGRDYTTNDGLALHVALKDDARFDGSRVLSHADKGDFGFQDKFSASAWINAESQTAPILTRADEKLDGEGWGLYLHEGRLQVNLIKRRLDDAIRVETKDKIPTSGWRHVAMTYDGSRLADGIRIYVDGKVQELNVVLDGLNQDFRTKEPFRIGGGGVPDTRFVGSIRDGRLYNRVLAADEVAVAATSRSVAEIAALAESQRSATEKLKLRQAFIEEGAPAGIRDAWIARRQARKARADYLESVPTVMVMEEMPAPKETFILRRGAYDQPDEKVSRGVPAALPPLPSGATPDRLGLAKWLVDPANPLTARVAVNRFWQSYFGTGIVKTVEDFGSQGEWPSHPDLLDWLATEFVQSGWNTKAIQRLIVTSATYRQSSKITPELSAKDPDNRLMARGPRLRLPAEALRDQALSMAGLLVPTIGGPSVKPYQPAGLWSALGDADYVPDTGEGLYRRSLYTFWKRTSAPPFMANFDSAMRESCTVRESRTNTPLQALNLMNDVTFIEAARMMAQRAIREGGTTGPDQLTYLFRLAVSRKPNENELSSLRQSLAFYTDHFQSNPQSAAELLRVGASPFDKSLPPSQLAALSTVASLILNLDETITKE